MPLKTFVKVGCISNLSDARYCAGMGVDMLGFRVIEGQNNYIKDSQFQAIRGWVTGPQIVAEVYGIQSHDQLTAIIENFRPDYLEMGLRELSLLSSTPPLPVILSVTADDHLEMISVQPAYLISSSAFSASIPLLVVVHDKTEVHPLLENTAVKGIALEGGTEIKPGLKNYEAMNEVLELLEIGD